MMRLLVLLPALCAAAAQPPFTLDQVTGAGFPTELVAAPSGGKVAWISNVRGVRNVMVAEPPGYEARKVTAYTADDGRELLDLRWSPDAAVIVYVRGEGASRSGEYPNPNSDPAGGTQDAWLARLDGAAPRTLGEGNSPAVSPRGDRVAFVRKGQVWSALLDGKTAAAQMFRARGTCGSLRWSPDGSRLAFVSSRGDHGFVGVYDVTANSVRYLDPSVDYDSNPAWSPEGKLLAFLRIPTNAGQRTYGPRRAGPPWSIRVADFATGGTCEVFRAAAGRGSVFRGMEADNQILWAAGDRLIFPWEQDGWTHLYSVSAEGGRPLLLTAGGFEVEHVSLAPGGRELVYSSNQADIDRRHIWKVPAAGGAAVALTSGAGIEWAPVLTSDGAMLAYLHSDAQRPARAAIGRAGSGAAAHDMDADAIPADFPAARMVTPEPVSLAGADGLPLHGQLFLPPHRNPARAPAVVFFHGGSRRQMLLGWHYMYYYNNAYAMNQFLANAGFIVLSVNYRSGTGYGLDFREALNYGPAGGSEYNDVQGAGMYLRHRADVDPARIYVWGGSYGGYLTAVALARASDLFAGGVDFHGVHDWSTELNMNQQEPAAKVAFQSSPMAYVKDWRSPVLLIHGDDDRNVQFNQTVVLAEALRRQRVPFEELIFPDEIHDFLVHRHWLEAYRATAAFLQRLAGASR